MGLHQHRLKQQKQLLLEDDLEIHGGGGGILVVFAKRQTLANATTRPKLLSLLFLSLLSCFLILAPHFFPSFYSLDSLSHIDSSLPLCSSVPNGTICCDRTSSIRTDVCVMKGDIRTQSSSSSIFLLTNQRSKIQHEKIRPYTRKWEASVMNTIDELHIISQPAGGQEDEHHRRCDVTHDVPAVVFSTGGYTGNVYHEFNDGLIPLYITSQHFNKQVVFVILEYHDWWITKYSDVLSQLTDYPAVDFTGDERTHCFPEAVVGLRIHDELTVNPSLMMEEGLTSNKSMVDFRRVLDRAYWPRIKGLMEDEQRAGGDGPDNSLSPPSRIANVPKLVIVSRTGSRKITNEDLLVKLAEKIGFQVEVLRPDPTTELAKIYRALNSSDVMIGVHGAAMTHFMFMKPGCVFIQVIPLGTEWAAGSYYGEPARKMGLKYIGYKILPRESSLYEKYDERDAVLRDPERVSQRGWEITKSIYLDGQNVVLDLKRFRKRLWRAYGYAMANVGRNQQQ
ncbi:Xylan glycosyltransferase MUCI21 [Linum grandiflorum]